MENYIITNKLVVFLKYNWCPAIIYIMAILVTSNFINLSWSYVDLISIVIMIKIFIFIII